MKLIGGITVHSRNDLFGWLDWRNYTCERIIPTQEYADINYLGIDIEYISDSNNGENAFLEKRIATETNDEAPLEEITVDEPCSIEELFQSSHSEYINDFRKG